MTKKNNVQRIEEKMLQNWYKLQFLRSLKYEQQTIL